MDTATEDMVAMEAMEDTVATTARGRLRLMPTMAMVDMEDTDTAMEAMVAMVAMEDTDTATEAMVAMDSATEAMVDTVATTARGRLRLMPTMAMVDMEDTDTAMEA